MSNYKSSPDETNVADIRGLPLRTLPALLAIVAELRLLALTIQFFLRSGFE